MTSRHVLVFVTIDSHRAADHAFEPGSMIRLCPPEVALMGVAWPPVMRAATACARESFTWCRLWHEQEGSAPQGDAPDRVGLQGSASLPPGRCSRDYAGNGQMPGVLSSAAARCGVTAAERHAGRLGVVGLREGR